MRLQDTAIPLTPSIEKRIEALRKQSFDLHIGILPELYIQVEIKNADGSDCDVKKYKANSVNRNYYNMLTGNFLSSYMNGGTFGGGYLNVKDITGTIRTNTDLNSILIASMGTSQGYNLSCSGGSGVVTSGVVVGTGTGAESFNGYALGTLIAHGTGAGQLQYGATSLISSTATYTAGTKTWSQSFMRSFTNGSGGTINVSECGLYTYGVYGSASYHAMMERTLFSPAIEVVNGKVLTLTYLISLTFPE